MEQIVRQVISGDSLARTRFEGIPEREPMIILNGCAYSRGREYPERIWLGESNVFTHTLLLGSSGCGKTNVISQIAAQLTNVPEGVCVIFDTKGDYKRHPAIKRDKDIVLEEAPGCPAWNIFDEITADGLDDGHVSLLAREVSQALFRSQKNDQNPFFYQAAADLFCAVLRCLVALGQRDPEKWKKYQNNRMLKTQCLLSNAKDYDWLFKQCREELPDVCRLAQNYLGSGGDSQALGILAELQLMLNRVFQGVFNLEPDANHASFSVINMIRRAKNQSLFIEYDIQKGEVLAPVYSLLIDLALKEALSPIRASSRAGGMFLILDELKLLPEISHLEDALNFGRGNRVGVVAGLQSVHQLETMYGTARSNVIMGGFGSLIAMQLNDAASRKHVSERCGTNIVVERKMGIGYKSVEERRSGYVVEDWDIQELTRGQAICKLSSQITPFKFEFQKDPYTK